MTRFKKAWQNGYEKLHGTMLDWCPPRPKFRRACCSNKRDNSASDLHVGQISREYFTKSPNSSSSRQRKRIVSCELQSTCGKTCIIHLYFAYSEFIGGKRIKASCVKFGEPLLAIYICMWRLDLKYSNVPSSEKWDQTRNKPISVSQGTSLARRPRCSACPRKGIIYFVSILTTTFSDSRIESKLQNLNTINPPTIFLRIQSQSFLPTKQRFIPPVFKTDIQYVTSCLAEKGG